MDDWNGGGARMIETDREKATEAGAKLYLSAAKPKAQL